MNRALAHGRLSLAIAAALIAALRSDEFKRLRENSERYVWLRDECDYDGAAHLMSLAPEELDAAIDTARTPEIAK